MAGVARGIAGAALLLAAAGSGALARDASWPMSPDQILLDNVSDRSTSFSVRAAGGDWQTLRIEPGQAMILSCPSCYAAIFDLSIRSDARTVTYDLVGGRHYRVLWNERIGALDVGRLSD